MNVTVTLIKEYRPLEVLCTLNYDLAKDRYVNVFVSPVECTDNEYDFRFFNTISTFDI